MPNSPAWPLPADVQTWLTTWGAWGGITDDLTDILQGIIDATVAGWEDDTGWCPFLSSGVDSTRYFSAPGPRQPKGYGIFGLGLCGNDEVVGGGNKLFLQTGLLSLTSLIKTTGETPETLTQDVDFILENYNSTVFTKVLFLRPQVYSNPKGIAITGEFGYCSTIPSLAWNAVRDKASATMLAPLANLRRVTAEIAQATLVKEIHTGPVSTTFAVANDASKVTDFSGLATQWQSNYDSAANNYMMV